jgi:Phage tail assembly chaperone protein
MFSIAPPVWSQPFDLVYARDPVWINAEHTAIDLWVKFSHFPNEVPFTAHPEDCEDHGRIIFQKAAAGEFGEVAEYTPPPPPTFEEQSVIVRQTRDQLLKETDWTQAADIPQTVKDKWTVYRQLLRDVPQQEGFPFNVVWPDKPV